MRNIKKLGICIVPCGMSFWESIEELDKLDGTSK